MFQIRPLLKDVVIYITQLMHRELLKYKLNDYRENYELHNSVQWSVWCIWNERAGTTNGMNMAAALCSQEGGSRELLDADDVLILREKMSPRRRRRRTSWQVFYSSDANVSAFFSWSQTPFLRHPCNSFSLASRSAGFHGSSSCRQLLTSPFDIHTPCYFWKICSFYKCMSAPQYKLNVISYNRVHI